MYGPHQSGYAGHGPGPSDGGSGTGAAVVAGAAGIAGGLVAAEVVDEVGDFFEGDSDDGED
ncbi:hypothetical protein SVIOM342S_07528 [Streptomyces violaceorubidus]